MTSVDFNVTFAFHTIHFRTTFALSDFRILYICSLSYFRAFAFYNFPNTAVDWLEAKSGT